MPKKKVKEKMYLMKDVTIYSDALLVVAKIIIQKEGITDRYICVVTPNRPFTDVERDRIYFPVSMSSESCIKASSLQRLNCHGRDYPSINACTEALKEELLDCKITVTKLER